MPRTGSRGRSGIWWALLLLCLTARLPADTVEVSVSGVDDPLKSNVLSHVETARILGARLDTRSQRDAYLEEMRAQAAAALRPWGYYRPRVDARLQAAAVPDAWTLRLDIDPGPAVTVGRVELDISGDGAGDAAFTDWRGNWPLARGARLDQTLWEGAKQALQDNAAANGYFLARFTAQRIELDLEQYRADLILHFETGPRARMGEIEFIQDVILPHVLRPLARFQPGDPYRRESVEQLRLDLWKSGYFKDIEVIEQQRLDQHPPVVDLQVRAESRSRNTHQGTLGYGTDTRIRLQYNWKRHYLSERGDTLGFGFGWRQRDSELLFSGEYRLPRQVESRQFWRVNSVLRRENQSLAIQDNAGRPFTLATGQVLDLQLTLGRLRFRNNDWSNKRIEETVFVDLLNERDSFGGSELPPPSSRREDLIDGLKQTVRTVAVGMDWDWPVIRGTRFATVGHHERAWWMTANEAWGSDKDFTQVYLSSRWNHLLSDRWKLLLRGEAAYTDARLHELEIDLDGDIARFAVTELPYRYRFKAGGSQSVRGYGFNNLSSNGIGSNHLLVGSIEIEHQFRENWSLAGFFDAGNAFNDWQSRQLKRGWGAGVRWYSLVGAVRFDLARAEDLEGKPWSFYITIGTPLL